MSDDRHYVGEVGTVIEVDTEADLSLADYVAVRIKKPDETTVELAGTVTETTKIRATLFDLELAGTYRVQSYVELPTPWEGTGKTATFRVYESFSTQGS